MMMRWGSSRKNLGQGFYLFFFYNQNLDLYFKLQKHIQQKQKKNENKIGPVRTYYMINTERYRTKERERKKKCFSYEFSRFYMKIYWGGSWYTTQVTNDEKKK